MEENTEFKITVLKRYQSDFMTLDEQYLKDEEESEK